MPLLVFSINSNAAHLVSLSTRSISQQIALKQARTRIGQNVSAHAIREVDPQDFLGNPSSAHHRYLLQITALADKTFDAAATI